MSKKRGEAVPARVLMLLTNEYRPDPRVRKEALALLQGGYSVNIICWNRRGGRPSAETAEGVKLDRVRTGVVDGPLGVILNYPLFAVKVFRRANGNGYDAVHAHDLDTLPIGVLLAWLKRVPLVFDAHEQYGRMIRTDLPNWIARLFERMEGKLLSKVDLGITVNGRIADTMRSSVKGVMLVVMNAVDVPDFAARNANREDGQI
ncbi:MAG: glycosyltransferase, partial [Methanomassiliicoccales archaeon]